MSFPIVSRKCPKMFGRLGQPVTSAVIVVTSFKILVLGSFRWVLEKKNIVNLLLYRGYVGTATAIAHSRAFQSSVFLKHEKHYNHSEVAAPNSTLLFSNWVPDDVSGFVIYLTVIFLTLHVTWELLYFWHLKRVYLGAHACILTGTTERIRIPSKY